MATQPALVGTIKLGLAQLANADGTNWKDLLAAGASGGKVVAVSLSSDDTVDRLVQLGILRSGTTYLLGTVNVPTLAGTNGTVPHVDALTLNNLPGLPLDNDGQHYLLLAASDKLQVRPTVAVTAAKAINAVAQGGDL